MQRQLGLQQPQALGLRPLAAQVGHLLLGLAIALLAIEQLDQSPADPLAALAQAHRLPVLRDGLLRAVLEFGDLRLRQDQGSPARPQRRGLVEPPPRSGSWSACPRRASAVSRTASA